MPSNRLFFPSMVQRHLETSQSSDDVNLDPFLASTSVDYTMDAQSIENSFNSIIASVHQNLREIRLAKVNAAREAREAEPKIEPAKEEPVDSKLKKNLTKSELSLQTTYRNDSKGMGLFGNLAQYNTRSIPQIKASFEQKLQQRMRRSIGRPTEVNNFTNQQRLREVLRQKRILEDILCEHEKIQRDRSTIAREIQMMKEYLNEIRGKLDTSLKKLHISKPNTDIPTRPRRVPPNRPIQNNAKKNPSKLVEKAGKPQQQQQQPRVSVDRGILH